MNLTPDETNAVLKALSVHIMSLRKRIDRFGTPAAIREETERELALCQAVRNKMEGNQDDQ